MKPFDFDNRSYTILVHYNGSFVNYTYTYNTLGRIISKQSQQQQNCCTLEDFEIAHQHDQTLLSQQLKYKGPPITVGIFSHDISYQKSLSPPPLGSPIRQETHFCASMSF